MMFNASLLTVLAVAASGALAAQDHPRLTKSYEDVRFRISYMHWTRGEAADTPDRHDNPVVMVFLNDGGLQMSSFGPVQKHRSGEVVYLEAGSSVTGGTLVSGDYLRALVVELKSTGSRLQLLPASVPPAFPRDDATTVMNNDRIAVWDALYRPTRPLPPMRHEHNTVRVWLDAVRLERALPDEPPQPHTFEAGTWEMVHAGMTISERALDRPARAVSIELK